MENFKQISIDNFYSKNQDEGGYVQECICCQKEVKNVKYFIHLLTNGNIINTDEDQGDEDQGAFPVGSVCRKKFPKDFIFTYND